MFDPIQSRLVDPFGISLAFLEEFASRGRTPIQLPKDHEVFFGAWPSILDIRGLSVITQRAVTDIKKEVALLDVEPHEWKF
jgi:hypothetical protein